MDVPGNDADELGVDEAFDRESDFESIIAPRNWRPPGEYYQVMPAEARRTISTVVASDERLRKEVRETYLPHLEQAGTIRCWEKANPQLIETLQRTMLYSGRVFAGDGTLVRYATLSLVGAQIAISKVSYRGGTGQIISNLMHWGQELPRTVTVADIVQAIKSRKKIHGESLSNLFLYALMTYKEREVLLDTPPGMFKLIQGPIFPHEMLTGAGRSKIMVTSLDLIKQMIDDGDYATIISSSSDSHLLDLGMALNAGEYLVVDTGEDVLMDFLYEDGDPSNQLKAHYTTTEFPEYGNKSQLHIFKDFMKDYGPRVVRAVLPAHRMILPYVFFSNPDRIDVPLHILL